MIKLAITGNIATGKSLVETFFNDDGVITLDTDKVVHDLLENDENTIIEINELFVSLGFDVQHQKGGISREKIGKIVFKDKEVLKKLEKILHPKVKQKVMDFFNNNEKEKIVGVMIPLLFEVGWENLFDYIVIVTADEETQIKRLIARNGFSREEALDRINAQIPQNEKIEKSDFVIDNTGSIDDSKKQVKTLLLRLLPL